jgi:NitT/TauT family transport system ATP-binding protein
MSALALELLDITVTFRAKDDPRQRHTAVADTTLRVAAGEFVSVVGPTGCGKSTLLNVGAGLLQPSSGQVSVFGEPLTGVNRRAGYMFQSDALMPWRSTIDNVMVGLQYRGLPDAQAREQARAWLARVGLAGFEEHYPHQLSGGMRKRTALAQVLALDPDIILMDEPFSALDVQTRQLMENEVLALWAGASEQRRAAPSAERAPMVGGGREATGGSNGRKAVLFITHDLDEAIAMSDRVVVLSAGPGTRPMGEFAVDLPRPRDVAEVRSHPRFVELHTQIWGVLRDEVLKGYAQQLKKPVLSPVGGAA